jgi:hypothetical protein
LARISGLDEDEQLQYPLAETRAEKGVRSSHGIDYFNIVMRLSQHSRQVVGPHATLGALFCHGRLRAGAREIEHLFEYSGRPDGRA